MMQDHYVAKTLRDVSYFEICTEKLNLVPLSRMLKD